MSMSIDSQMALNTAASQDLEARRRQVESLSSRMSDEERSAKLRQSAQDFEAIFIQKMWEQMRATLPKDGFLKSREEEFWQQMYDQELGKSMAASGGIGLADMMVEQLDRNNEAMSSASRSTAYRRGGFDIQPVPILPVSQNQAEPVQAASPAPAASAAPLASAPVLGGSDLYEEAVLPAADLYEDAEFTAPLPENANGDIVRQTLDEMAGLAAVQQQAALGWTQANRGTISTAPQENVQLKFQQMTGQAPYRPETVRHVPPVSGLSEAAGQSPVREAAPVVTRVTYQTNLPPGQRTAQPDLARIFQPETSVRQPLSQASSPSGLAGVLPAPVEPAPVAPVPVAPVPTAAETPAEPVAEARIASSGQVRPLTGPQDILAGITPRFIPSRLTARVAPADADTAAAQAGGPVLLFPEEVTTPVSLGNPAPPKGSLMPPVRGEISSAFGWRQDPITGQRAWHTGVDVKAEPEEAVRSAMAGTVSFAGEHPALGKLIVLEHGDGLRTFYGHNAELQVQVGQQIDAGTEVAKAGSSGRAAGTHVHFEVRRGSLALNPEPLFGRPGMEIAATR